MSVDPHFALYVWGAYGVSAAVLLTLAADTLLRARRWRSLAEHREAESRGSPS